MQSLTDVWSDLGLNIIIIITRPKRDILYTRVQYDIVYLEQKNILIRHAYL